MTASSPRGTFSQTELTADRVIQRVITRSAWPVASGARTRHGRVSAARSAHRRRRIRHARAERKPRLVLFVRSDRSCSRRATARSSGPGSCSSVLTASGRCARARLWPRPMTSLSSVPMDLCRRLRSFLADTGGRLPASACGPKWRTFAAASHERNHPVDRDRRAGHRGGHRGLRDVGGAGLGAERRGHQPGVCPV